MNCIKIDLNRFHPLLILITTILIFYNYILFDYNYPEKFIYFKYVYDISCASVIIIFFFLIFSEKLHIKIKNIIILICVCFILILKFNIFCFKLVPFYLTDSAAHLHYAGILQNSGQNPYKYDMSEAPKKLGMPYEVQSITNDGSFLKKYSYPPGSFILSALLLKIGFSDLRIPAFILTIAIILFLFFYFHSELSKIILIITVLSMRDVVDLPVSSLFEIFWMVLLLAAYILIIKKNIWSALFLALAVSFKHTPFYTAPFLFIYAFKEMGLKKFFIFIFIFIIGVIIINSSYIFSEYNLIVKSVILPFTDLPSTGFGFYYLNKFFSSLNDKENHLIFQAIISAGLLIFYFLKFNFLKTYTFIFPIIILMFNWRCQGNYFYCYFILAIISALMDMEIFFIEKNFLDERRQ